MESPDKGNGIDENVAKNVTGFSPSAYAGARDVTNHVIAYHDFKRMFGLVDYIVAHSSHKQQQ